MSEKSGYVKVGFALEDGPVGSEGIWCVPEGEDRYRVDNIPAFVYDVSVGDLIIATNDADGLLTFRRVHEKRGHATLRVFFDPELCTEGERTGILDGIPLRRGSEYGTERFGPIQCIDLEPAALDRYREVLQYLSGYEQRELIAVEEGDRDCVPVEALPRRGR